MTFTRHSRRLYALMTALVVLAAALMPALAQVLERKQGRADTWAEVCSTSGSKRLIKLDLGAPAQTGMEGLAHAKHCPFCLAHGATASMPPPSLASLPLLPARPVLPALYYQAPRPLFSWATTRSRGPPAFV